MLAFGSNPREDINKSKQIRAFWLKIWKANKEEMSDEDV